MNVLTSINAWRDRERNAIRTRAAREATWGFCEAQVHPVGTRRHTRHKSPWSFASSSASTRSLRAPRFRAVDGRALVIGIVGVLGNMRVRQSLNTKKQHGIRTHLGEARRNGIRDRSGEAGL